MSDERQKIEAKVLKDMGYIKIINMPAEQKEKIVDRKQAEITKAFVALGKYAYGEQLKGVFRSPSYLVIEKLILDGFGNKSIAKYIQEVFTEDKLSKLSLSSLESYISKLRKGVTHSRLLLTAHHKDKKKALHYENRLDKAVNEIESIGYLTNLQEERIRQMRQKEIDDDEINKDLRKEIEVGIKLVKATSELKEVLGANQNANKNPIEELRGRISGEFSNILNRESAKKIRDMIASLINLPHSSNIITDAEVEKISPLMSGDVLSLKQAKEEFDKGKYGADDTFFDIPRKHSTLLSMGIRDSADTDLIDKDKMKNKYKIPLDIPSSLVDNIEDELIEDGLDDEDDMVESEIVDENDLEEFE